LYADGGDDNFPQFTSTYLSNYMASGRMGSKPKTFMPSIVTSTFVYINKFCALTSISVSNVSYIPGLYLLSHMDALNSHVLDWTS